jgi:hypothetical protein
VLLECEAQGDVPLPDELPEVVWRGGIDLDPVDVHDEDATGWLQTLVWPEHEDRRSRLAAAVDLARDDPPRLVRGDLNRTLPALVQQVPQDATLVVFHSAVLAYLPAQDRAEFARTAQSLPGHWVSNEGATVLPDLTATASAEPAADSAVGPVPLLLALDGQAVAWTHGHGRCVWWL